MEIIGLTGGIGSGKSTVAKIFEQHGVPCFNCDDEARHIQDDDPRAVEGMKMLFGDDIYDEHGHLQRRRVGEVAFRDSSLLAKINELVHPLVYESFMKFKAANEQHKFVLIESAILIQSGFYKLTDGCIFVKAGLEARIARVMRRDGLTREQVLLRIKNQMPEEEMLRYCKYVVFNNGYVPQIESQILHAVQTGDFSDLIY